MTELVDLGGAESESQWVVAEISRPPKVAARKGQKKVRYVSSGRKNQITIVACGSATGQPIPQFVIFNAKQLNLSLIPGLLRFSSSVCVVQYTEAEQSAKNREGLVTSWDNA